MGSGATSSFPAHPSSERVEGRDVAGVDPVCVSQPIREEALLTGALEPTNEWYAIAKIAGIKLCEALRSQHGFDAISLMPTKLYGPGDNYHPTNSHVLPALIRRFHEAAEANAPSVTCWGTGSPLREFLMWMLWVRPACSL